MKELENKQQQDKAGEGDQNPVDEQQKSANKGYLLPLFLFLVVVGLLGAGGYFGWQQMTAYRLQTENRFSELQAQIDQRATRSQLDNGIRPLQQSVGRSDSRLARLEQGQQDLLTATEKLYEMFGRDENSWKLAEVEYLMSIAQHKLVLEHDFAGAGRTLDAASTLIAELADPGLLPVRVQISDEIAQLKTRARPDLVGMTLLLARLGRQITALQPGYKPKLEDSEPLAAATEIKPPADDKQPITERVRAFVNSLVTIKTQQPNADKAPEPVLIDITEKLEDNLKLTRWTVLDRDAFQYEKLMQQNVALFKQYYDLENAVNAEFYQSLLELQKSSIKPELPDIGGSLRLLREIIKKREDSPAQAPQEVSND